MDGAVAADRDEKPGPFCERGTRQLGGVARALGKVDLVLELALVEVTPNLG
jgi:hypothetical protein